MSDTTIKEYPEITGYGYIKDQKVYLKGYFEFKDREIGVVRESDEESLKYFITRFEMVTAKIQSVKESIETSENKGSYLMKLIHMRTYLAQFNGLGNFIELFNQINDMEDHIRVYIEKNREKNFEIKTALLADANSVKGSTDWKYASNKMKELKLKWIKTGSAHKEVDDQLNEDFNKALEYFFERRKDFFKEQARIMSDRFMRYRQMISQVKRINQEGSDPSQVSKVKAIQRDWKAVGRVPKFKFRKLTMDFKKELDIYFGAIKYKTAIKDKSVTEVKRDLLVEVEKILNGTTRFNINQVKEVQNKWKQLGKQPSQEDKDLNLRFRIACNELFEEHFLDKSAKYLHPDLNTKPMTEQYKLKIAVLIDSIKKDEKELEDYQKANAFELSRFNKNASNSPVFQERNNFINKLKTKNRILKKLEERLEALY